MAYSASQGLNGGILVVLQDGLMEQNKEDVQNSLLSSQLTADKKYTCHDNTGWYPDFLIV